MLHRFAVLLHCGVGKVGWGRTYSFYASMMRSAESLVDAVDGGIPTISRKLGAMLTLRLVYSSHVVNNDGSELSNVLYRVWI